MDAALRSLSSAACMLRYYENVTGLGSVPMTGDQF